VLHSCFARWKGLYIVDFVENWYAAGSADMRYTLRVVSAFLWIFFCANGRGGQGRANAMS
jgi:hypothetical protein